MSPGTIVALLIQADRFRQFADREMVTDHAEAFEQGGGLGPQALEGVQAESQDQQGIGEGQHPQEAVNGGPAADYKGVLALGMHRLEARLDGPALGIEPHDRRRLGRRQWLYGVFALVLGADPADGHHSADDLQTAQTRIESGRRYGVKTMVVTLIAGSGGDGAAAQCEVRGSWTAPRERSEVMNIATRFGIVGALGLAIVGAATLPREARAEVAALMAEARP